MSSGRRSFLLRALILVSAATCALIVAASPLLPEALRRPLTWTVFVLAAGALVLLRSGRSLRRAAVGAALLAVLAGCALASLRPSAERDWRPQEARIVRSRIEGDRVELFDVRDFDFAPDGSPRERWIDGVWDLSELRGVDLIVSYWPSSRAVAHTMMSFDFGDARTLCLSVEARRERGEDWGVLTGLCRSFELVYILGTERDLVGQRAVQRGERLYLFRTVLSADESRRLFSAVLAGAEELRRSPRFYNTISANCTTTLVRHLNEVWPERPPYTETILRNGYAPEIALRTGLVKSDATIEDLKARSEITASARLAAGVEEFSLRIRGVE